MGLIKDFKKFKEQKVGEAFTNEQKFFEERYGFPLYPFAQDIFKELLRMQSVLDEHFEE